MLSRRIFLQQSTIVSAGLLMRPSSCKSDLAKKHAVGLQLYTLRDIIGKDTEGTIKGIAAAGYTELEMFGLDKDYKFFGRTPAEFSALLKANNISSPSGHYVFEDFLFNNGNGDDLKKTCDVARVMGNSYVIIPWLQPNRRENIDQYKKLAERINLAGKIVKDAGMQLAYHNHDFEFHDFGGEHGYNILLNQTDKDLLRMEMDLYWVVRAGYDPITLFKQHPGRFELWHVKDMDKADRTQNTEVGNGSIDFANIFANARLAGVKHFLVEQENNYKPDFMGSIATSSNAVKGLFKSLA